MTSATATRTRPIIAPDGYKVTADLNTYTPSPINARRLRAGMIIVGECGFAAGVVVAELYGARTFWIRDADTGQTTTCKFDTSSILHVATSVVTTW